jgi:hypothetical protein
MKSDVRPRGKGGANVQPVIVAIDQYAEAATGNREYFWNKPHAIDGPRRGDIP